MNTKFLILFLSYFKLSRRFRQRLSNETFSKNLYNSPWTKWTYNGHRKWTYLKVLRSTLDENWKISGQFYVQLGMSKTKQNIINEIILRVQEYKLEKSIIFSEHLKKRKETIPIITLIRTKNVSMHVTTKNILSNFKNPPFNYLIFLQR